MQDQPETNAAVAGEGYFADDLQGAAPAAPVAEKEAEAEESGEAEQAAPQMLNHHNKEKVAGPSATLTLQQAVAIAVTPRTFFSKRLAPPMTLCNGRVYCGDDYIYGSDIVVPECAQRLARVAHGFGVRLELRYESGDRVLWNSDEPEIWHGLEKPVSIQDAMTLYYEPAAEKQRAQWQKDHGVKLPKSGVSATVHPIRSKPKAKAKTKAKPKAKAKVKASAKRHKPKLHKKGKVTVSEYGKRIGRPPGSKDKKPRAKPGQKAKVKAPARKAASVKKKTAKK